MAVVKLRWSTLFNLTELEFVPGPPSVIKVSDELLQTISWLTGATGHDRRLLRCTDQGALLVADAWSNLGVVDTDELYPQSAGSDITAALATNKGVLIAASTQLIKVTIIRADSGGTEIIYIPPAWLYWYAFPVLTIEAAVVPDPGGAASYVGITVFN